MFEKAIEDFSKNGFAVIPEFMTEDEVNSLKNSIYSMVEKIDVEKEKQETDDTVNPNIDTLASDKIKFWFEKEAFDKDGKLKVDKHKALFRIGFGLHVLDPAFKKFTFGNQNIQKLSKELGLVKPRVAQSMYIFKNPDIGALFIPHQDATYLHAIGDELREVGLWFPMENANEENGCLWFIPGSHKTGLHRQFIPENGNKNAKYVFTKDNPEYKDSDFVSAQVKRGSCVLIDGLVVHKSAENRSKNPRPIYTFHMYDNSTCEWDPKNWIQPTPVNPFPELYANGN